MKIGFLGGTFNPIHNGHILMAQKAKKDFALDKVFFLPTGDSYMKSEVTDKYIRMDMVYAATDGIDGLDVCDIEVRREGPSYTSETLKELLCLYPADDIFFILGEDSLATIHLWKNYEDIFKMTKIIVAGRASSSENGLLQEKTLEDLISSYENNMGAILYSMDFNCEYSSSEIREKVYNGISIRNEVCPKVEKIIREKKLYQKDV